MDTIEKIKKLQTLPWQALYDTAIAKGLEEKSVKSKDKEIIIELLLSNGKLTDDEIETLVNDYIYGDRVTFTLWTFHAALQKQDHDKIHSMMGKEEALIVAGYRNLKFISVKDIDDRIEVLYVYSKEYSYINEDGYNDSVWEQHRGCLWIGKNATYLACISKHDKMTQCITKYVSICLNNKVTQIKPPKVAIDRCANSKAISRIVLQGASGEKTVVSRSGGITEEQEEEIGRIRADRIDTSGSFIAEITENIDATIKYNVRNGSVGIYKHLPASVLFKWSENAIKIILQEIEKLKGKPVEEIFKELGQEIKWTGINTIEGSQLNWFLTQLIASLEKDEHQCQIPEDKLSVLENDKLFIKCPRIYCKECDSYEIAYCANCGQELVFNKGKIAECGCGAPRRIKCSEGHEYCEIVNWYLPQRSFVSMINKNIQKVYKDYVLEYDFCIVGDQLYISWNQQKMSGVEVPFNVIECFKCDMQEHSRRLQEYAVTLNEKCGKSCSKEKIRECLKSEDMVCLPKVFYSIIPNFRPQPHKGLEYGDVSGEVKVGTQAYELKGIIKRNSRHSPQIKATIDDKIETLLLSSTSAGQEIIRQFVEQGMSDTRCQLVAVIVPQYIDASFKGTLRYLARLSGKKVTFIELNEICDLISMNPNINIT